MPGRSLLETKMSNYFQQIKKAAVESLKYPGKAKKPLPKAKSEKDSIIYIFRHTETYDNKNRIFSGQRNAQLTPNGKNQAEKLAKMLKNKQIHIGFFPNLDRCKDTLKIALKYHKKVKIKITKDLLERDYGKLTGQSKLEWMKKEPELTIKYRRAWDFPPPGGESLKMVKKRLFPFCDKVVKMAKKKKLGIAICGTGNTMKLMRMYFEKLPIIKILTLESPFGDYASYTVKILSTKS